MLKSIIKFIDKEVTQVRETNNRIYLSDGTDWKKHAFHSKRALVAQLRNKELSISNNLLKEAKLEAQANALKELVRQFEPTKPAEVIPKDKMAVPTPTNRRFVCGYTATIDPVTGVHGDEIFQMIFWNYFPGVPNSHSDLADYFVKNYDETFRATSGGFYMSNGHNNCNGDQRNKFYLFGRSDSYGTFQGEIEAIKSYGTAHNLQFIIGRTNFSDDAVDQHGHYLGSDELSEFQ